MLNFTKREIFNIYLIITFFNLLFSGFVYAENPKKDLITVTTSWTYEKNIAAFDEGIKEAIKENDEEKLSYLYSEKAAYIFNKKKYTEALQNYILAHNYADKLKDEYNYYSILYGIALIKQQLQEFDESKKFLVECKEYFEKNLDDPNFQKGYVNTVGRLSYLSLMKQDLQSARNFNALEIKNSVDSIDYFYAIKNKGLIEHHAKNYDLSNTLLKKSRPYIANDPSWNLILHQYIGENYYHLKDFERAKFYYQFVFNNYLKNKLSINEIRLSFERLIEYYKTNDDHKNQLLYIDHLLQFDQNFNQVNKFLAKSYYQDYETKNLLSEKNNLINKIEQRNYLYILLCFVIITIICVSSYLFLRKQKKTLKECLDALDMFIAKEKKSKNVKKAIYQKPINSPLNQQLEDKIIDFENNKLFLNQALSLESLAKDLDTNRTNLSQHINQSRNKTFKQYINDLRINYIIDMLISDPKMKNRTMDDLAEIAGYNNRKTFSDCFIQVTGVRPSYFIKNTRHL